MRPRRNPCHCRANHRWFATPCGLVWGRPLTDSVASVTTGATVFTLPGQTSRVSLNLRLKTEVCACISINEKAFSAVDNDDNDRGGRGTNTRRSRCGWTTRRLQTLSKTERYDSASVRNRTTTSKASCAAHKTSLTRSRRQWKIMTDMLALPKHSGETDAKNCTSRSRTNPPK
jgi:hypothetical protein